MIDYSSSKTVRPAEEKEGTRADWDVSWWIPRYFVHERILTSKTRKWLFLLLGYGLDKKSSFSSGPAFLTPAEGFMQACIECHNLQHHLSCLAPLLQAERFMEACSKDHRIPPCRLSRLAEEEKKKMQKDEPKCRLVVLQYLGHGRRRMLQQDIPVSNSLFESQGWNVGSRSAVPKVGTIEDRPGV